MALVTDTENTSPAPRIGLPIRGSRRWARYSDRTFYLFISPWLLGFIALTIIPFIYALLVSFTNFDGISVWRWIGLRNYNEIFHDPETLASLRQTIFYLLATVPLGILGGLGLALLLDRKLHGIGIFRTLFYLPSVVPVVAAAIIWRSVFARDTGILNALIEHFGGPTITWLIDPTAFWALVIMVLWGMGGGMIISLAGLQGIPTELKEAAAVDGATGWQILRSVTLPLLTPVLFFQVVMGIIASLQTLIQPLLLAETGGVAHGGVIPRVNHFYMVQVYEKFFFDQRFGYGSALLWVLFAVILLMTLLIFRSSLFWVYYEVDRERG